MNGPIDQAMPPLSEPSLDRGEVGGVGRGKGEEISTGLFGQVYRTGAIAGPRRTTPEDLRQ